MSMIWRVAFPPPRTSSPHSSGLIARGGKRRVLGDLHSAISVRCVARTLNAVPGGRYTACG